MGDAAIAPTPTIPGPQPPLPASDGAAAGDQAHRGPLALLTITALGVVYGDIGTSPIYALNLCFRGAARVTPSEPAVLGVLSLIFWSLAIVISGKYLIFVMRADNRGEGGILALLALIDPWGARRGTTKSRLMLLGVVGAALLYGDGTITPAISVLSAVEGLGVAAPVFEPFVVPITVSILVGLFLFQRRGTAGVGAVFGPVMLVWFFCLAALGISGIWHAPQVLWAIDPRHAVGFLLSHGFTGLTVLGFVFLAVTGGEALYADMGHFGRNPIRLAWFALVLPSLVINYFGQGAYLLTAPTGTHNPFFQLAPGWALYPLVGMATVATVIASQAVITGAFSLSRQAVQLGLLPRLEILQTSHTEIGQVYVGAVNWLLMLATIGLVLGFGSSAALASAYGIAITAAMAIDTVLAYFVARGWGWPPVALAALCAMFLAVDLTFFSANALKIVDGGWYPLLAGLAVFTLMTTWRRGRELLARRLGQGRQSLDDFFDEIRRKRPHRPAGTAVFLTSDPEGTSPMLVHHLERNRVLHKHVVLLTVLVDNVPRLPAAERLSVQRLRLGFRRVIVRYGFMEMPNVPLALRRCKDLGLSIDLDRATYYLGRETVIPSDRRVGMAIWRERLFAAMSRNAARATTYFRLPPAQVVELGIQVEM